MTRRSMSLPAPNVPLTNDPKSTIRSGRKAAIRRSTVRWTSGGSRGMVSCDVKIHHQDHIADLVTAQGLKIGSALSLQLEIPRAERRIGWHHNRATTNIWLSYTRYRSERQRCRRQRRLRHEDEVPWRPGYSKHGHAANSNRLPSGPWREL